MSFVHDCIRLAIIQKKRFNERSVQWQGHCTVMPPVSRGTTGPATDRSGGERGETGHSDVCLPLPNGPATSSQHLTIVPSRLPSPYSACITLRLCPKVHHCNIMILTQNSFPYAMYVIPFSVVGPPEVHLHCTPVSVVCCVAAAETECEMGCCNRNRNRTETAL